MTPQPGTAGTGDDPLAQLVTQELTVNGQTVTRLVGLAFDSADQTDGVLRFDGTGSTNGIADGSAKVLVNGTVYNVAGAEWVDLSGTKHTVDSWEKVINSQFDVSITGTTSPVAPGNTLDVTADVTNSGTDQDTQTVTLDINNGVGQVDSASVTLSGGGSTTQTLSWAVPSNQTKQDYQATVASADDSASQTVTVGSAIPSSVVQRPNDDDSFGNSSKFGMVVEPTQDWPDIGAELSNNIAGATRAYIYDFSDGTLLGDADISGLTAGDTFTFGVSLSAGGQYSFVADAQGSSYTVGRDDNASYPYVSPDGNLELTGSIEPGAGLTSFGNPTHGYTFTRIGDVGF